MSKAKEEGSSNNLTHHSSFHHSSHCSQTVRHTQNPEGYTQAHPDSWTHQTSIP